MTNPWPQYTFEVNPIFLKNITTTTWLANLFPGTANVDINNQKQFTVYGQQAIYLKKTYCSNPPNVLSDTLFITNANGVSIPYPPDTTNPIPQPPTNPSGPLSTVLSIAASEIDPVLQQPGVVTTGRLNMQKFNRAMFILTVGDVGAAGTVDAKLQQSPTGTGQWIDIIGGAIIQIAAADRVATIEVRANQLATGYYYVRLNVDVGTNGVYLAAIPLGGEAFVQPASANDVGAVAQRLMVPN